MGTRGTGTGSTPGDGPAPQRQLLERCSFPPGSGPLVAAVSGGPDSLALLVLACATGRPVLAVHVDHGLRTGSAAEADVVAAAAARFGAGFEARQAQVADGPDLEARARRARYGLLPPGVLTGHTADDQAETVLLNLLRGSGVDGLAGMRPSPVAVRPLLGLRRSETHDLCRRLGLVPVDDPSNRDLRFRRNRVRHELLPVLERVGGRDPVPVLVRQAGLLADDADLLEELSAGLDPGDVAALLGAPVPLARRAVRRWLRRGDEQHPPGSADVERVLAVAAGAALACEVGGGRRVRRSQGRLHLDPPGSVGAAMETPPR
jgi:tRNA(Ile)-lysidine synthase